MKMKIFLLKFQIIILCFLPILLFEPNRANGFTGQVIQKGAVGDDVIELQSRLQNIGYFHGKIDGVFGWSTYWALRNFQHEYGLPVDGLAGQSTKAKLTKVSNYNEQLVKSQINKGNNINTNSSKGGNNQTGANGNTANNKAATPPNKPTSVNIPKGFSQNDIRLMANAVYGESRGEPYIGQVAVAAVILNRVQSQAFPNTVSGVIFQPGAFTAVADGQIYLTPNDTAKKAVIDAINGWDPTDNALYYFNPATATSPWIWSRPQIKRIGKHIFCH
jgi:N-acetylmuramoyl-L-alanine amidase